MNLNEWAIKHQIPYAALNELKQLFGSVSTEPREAITGESEAAVQNGVRLEASRKGCRIWRNNVGALLDERGVPVRYGLCNDSKQMNKKVKSSDLIGIKPVKITNIHVGLTLGVFLAREVKHSLWHYTGTDEEKAQLKFLELVASLGGDAAFTTREGTI